MLFFISSIIVLFADLLLEELHSEFKERMDLLFGLAFEEVRTGGDERLHQPDAVGAGAAPDLRDPLLGHSPVFVGGLDQMDVVLRSAGDFKSWISETISRKSSIATLGLSILLFRIVIERLPAGA